MSILPKELSDFKYYVKKCPLYLQNDENFLEHFKIWFDFMIGKANASGCIPVSDTLLSLINVFDYDYINKLNSLGEGNSDILDKLGSIFNIRRNLSITDENNTIQLNLNDNDFLLFLKAQIIKNYSDGTYSQMREFYDKSGLEICFDYSGSTNAMVGVFLFNSLDVSDDVKQLFKAGLLTIQSMGIQYIYSIQDIATLGIWDNESNPAQTGWDGGKWSL